MQPGLGADPLRPALPGSPPRWPARGRPAPLTRRPGASGVGDHGDHGDHGPAPGAGLVGHNLRKRYGRPKRAALDISFPGVMAGAVGARRKRCHS